MQIIENSIVGTRSAVLRLTRRGGGPDIVIFPMLHVAEPQFFRAVEARLASAICWSSKESRVRPRPSTA